MALDNTDKPGVHEATIQLASQARIAPIAPHTFEELGISVEKAMKNIGSVINAARSVQSAIEAIGDAEHPSAAAAQSRAIPKPSPNDHGK